MTAATPDAAARPRAARIVFLTVAIAFGLLYAYDLFEAIANAFGVVAQLSDYNELAAEVGLDEDAVPWGILVANILLAPLLYTGAFLIARRHTVPTAALVFLGGLAVVGALSLSLAAVA